MGLINEFVVKEKLLKEINNAFDEEINSSASITALGLESEINGKDDFMKKVEEIVDKLIMNQKV